MAWRTLATVLIVVFAALIVMTVTARPISEVEDGFIELTDDQDKKDKLSGIVSSYFNMFIVLFIGVMSWGVWWLYQNELTRQRGGLP